MCLGRDFSLYGTIIKGKSRGRILGFPTANLELLDEEQIIPKVGLYYVNFVDGHESYKALCNIGHRPTFDDDNVLSIESYVIENDNFNFYGKKIRIEFLKYVRDEIAFASKIIMERNRVIAEGAAAASVAAAIAGKAGCRLWSSGRRRNRTSGLTAGFAGRASSDRKNHPPQGRRAGQPEHADSCVGFV